MSADDRHRDSSETRKGVGGDPRELNADVAEAPGKIWFRDLDEAVIEADRCVQCASCVAACPSDSIGIDEEEHRPTLVRMCTGCSRCWDFCPRSGLRYERLVELLGQERALETPATYAVRAKGKAVSVGQDGGAVTALLAELIGAGRLDGAIVATESAADPLRGEPALATSREELLEAGGSIYTQTMGLGRIDELLEANALGDDPALALVGTPCMIQGAAALDRYDHEPADPIVLTIALMCTRSFEHGRLLSQLESFDVDPDAIDRVDVTGGVLSAYDDADDPLLETDVEEFDAAGLRGCGECADFVGGTADISAGTIGSDDGYTTLIVRTKSGRAAFESAESGFESIEIDRPDTLEELATWNRRRAESVLQRDFDPEAAIGISYDHHRRTYDGTDREPKSLNPARVHQYEEWC